MKNFIVKIENWIAGLNNNQRLIIAVFTPLVLLTIALPSASGLSYMGEILNEDNWFIWLLYFAISGAIVYKLYSKK